MQTLDHCRATHRRQCIALMSLPRLGELILAGAGRPPTRVGTHHSQRHASFIFWVASLCATAPAPWRHRTTARISSSTLTHTPRYRCRYPRYEPLFTACEAAASAGARAPAGAGSPSAALSGPGAPSSGPGAPSSGPCPSSSGSEAATPSSPETPAAASAAPAGSAARGGADAGCRGGAAALGRRRETLAAAADAVLASRAYRPLTSSHASCSGAERHRSHRDSSHRGGPAGVPHYSSAEPRLAPARGATATPLCRCGPHGAGVAGVRACAPPVGSTQLLACCTGAALDAPAGCHTAARGPRRSSAGPARRGTGARGASPRQRRPPAPPRPRPPRCPAASCAARGPTQPEATQPACALADALPDLTGRTTCGM